MDKEQIIIKRKAEQILHENQGYILRDFKIDDRLYSVKPFSVRDEDVVAKFYMDDYVNAMVLSCTPKTKIAIETKLNYILEQQEQYGLSYWKIQSCYNSDILGLIGITCENGEYELNCMAVGGCICVYVLYEIFGIAFEKLGIKKLISRALSYNIPSIVMSRRLGMIPDGLEKMNNYKKDEYLVRCTITKDLYEANRRKNPNIVDFSLRKSLPKDLHPNARMLGDYRKSCKVASIATYLDKLDAIIKSRYAKNIARQIFGI